MKKCPECGEGRHHVYYTAPLRYVCSGCGHTWDDGGPAVKVLTPEEARAKRPSLYELITEADAEILRNADRSVRSEIWATSEEDLVRIKGIIERVIKQGGDE